MREIDDQIEMHSQNEKKFPSFAAKYRLLVQELKRHREELLAENVSGAQKLEVARSVINTLKSELQASFYKATKALLNAKDGVITQPQSSVQENEEAP